MPVMKATPTEGLAQREPHLSLFGAGPGSGSQGALLADHGPSRHERLLKGNP